MADIETIQILDEIFVNVYEWCVGYFGPTWGALAFLFILGVMLWIVVPTGETTVYDR